MRKRLRILILSAIVAAVVVPVGFALSLDPSRTLHVASPRGDPYAETIATTSPIVATTTAAVTKLPDLPDAAKLLLAGSVLLGLAAAVRRTT